MLNDVHSICGYLIAKYLFEAKYANRLRFPPHLQRMAEALPTDSSSLRTSHSQQKKREPFLSMLVKLVKDYQKQSPTKIFSYISNWYRKLPFETKYLLVGAVLGNLPDFDVLLAPLFPGGHHRYHRTFSHSLIGNAVFVPTAAAAVHRLLNMHPHTYTNAFRHTCGTVSYRHCLQLVSLCVGSHLLTDWITNYGTALLWPLSSKQYSLGVITVLDLITVVYFYALLILSRLVSRGVLTRLKHRHVFWIGCITFPIFMLWKRSNLFKAHMVARQYRNRTAQNNTYGYNKQTWLQPSNLRSGRFYLLTRHERTQHVQGITAIDVRSLNLLRFILYITKYCRKDKLGFSDNVVAPRGYFHHMQPKLLRTLSIESAPTIIFVIVFHIVNIILSLKS